MVQSGDQVMSPERREIMIHILTCWRPRVLGQMLDTGLASLKMGAP